MGRSHAVVVVVGARRHGRAQSGRRRPIEQAFAGFSCISLPPPAATHHYVSHGIINRESLGAVSGWKSRRPRPGILVVASSLSHGQRSDVAPGRLLPVVARASSPGHITIQANVLERKAGGGRAVTGVDSAVGIHRRHVGREGRCTRTRGYFSIRIRHALLCAAAKAVSGTLSSRSSPFSVCFRHAVDVTRLKSMLMTTTTTTTEAGPGLVQQRRQNDVASLCAPRVVGVSGVGHVVDVANGLAQRREVEHHGLLGSTLPQLA